MFTFLKNKISAYFGKSFEKQYSVSSYTPLNESLSENIITLRKLFHNSSDLVIRQMEVGEHECAVIHIEGMVNKLDLAVSVIEPMTSAEYKKYTSGDELFKFVRDNVLCAPDQSQSVCFEDVAEMIMSGFAAVIIDGAPKAAIIGVHGFQFRSISEPTAETVQNGSREGFSEVLRISMTQIRRRIKSPELIFEFMNVGSESGTNICLCYLDNMVSKQLLEDIRVRLKKTGLKTVLGAQYLIPYLEDKSFSLFNSLGTTERPDVLCGKISEGRIGILVDGNPQAIIIPYLFAEHFQTFDDYTFRPAFATFSRILRFFAFFIALFLPGIYVAMGTFHHEFFTADTIRFLAEAEASTPFSIMTEAIIIHFVFELVREAGLRMPRPVGNAVSVAGALVIGDAAINAGIVSSPMVMIVAITGLSAFVVPSLYEQIAFLRFVLIIVGGLFGLYGLTAAIAIILTALCSINSGGIPFSAPVSPFRLKSMRDFLVRVGWPTLSGKAVNINKMPGSKLKR